MKVYCKVCNTLVGDIANGSQIRKGTVYLCNKHGLLADNNAVDLEKFKHFFSRSKDKSLFEKLFGDNS